MATTSFFYQLDKLTGKFVKKAWAPVMEAVKYPQPNIRGRNYKKKKK